MSSVGERGFTLVEAAVAVAVVGIVAVAALAAAGAELRATEHAARTIEAAVLAQHRLAEAELLPAEDLARIAAAGAAGRFEPPFEEYTWELSVAQAPAGGPLLDVTVRVGWPGGSYAIAGRFVRSTGAGEER